MHYLETVQRDRARNVHENDTKEGWLHNNSEINNVYLSSAQKAVSDCLIDLTFVRHFFIIVLNFPMQYAYKVHNAFDAKCFDNK